MKVKRLICLLLAVVIIGSLVLTACSSEEETHDDTMPPPEVLEEEEPEALPPVQVSMPDYELAYSGELKDLLVVNELSDEENGSLEFQVALSTGNCKVFVLHFNTDQGELVTMLDQADGEKVPVAFEMAELPADLNEADAELFYTAQDAVNEIVSSLKLR